MDHTSLSFKLAAAIILSVFAASIPTSRCENGEDRQFAECSRPFNCGRSFANLSYPFWGGGRPQICGHRGFELNCFNDSYPVIYINDLGFRILKINQSTRTDVSRIRIARLDTWDGPCSSQIRFVNTTLNYPLFSFAQTGPARVSNLTFLYGCAKPPFPEGNSAACEKFGTVFYYQNDTSFEGPKAVNTTTCQNVIRVPISGDYSFEGNKRIEEVLKQGFEVEYDSNIERDCENCEKDLHGVCGSDNTTTFPKFHCFCRGPNGCSLVSDLQSELRNIIVGSATGAIVILIIVCVLICCYRKTKSCIRSTRIWKRMKKKKERDLEAVIRGDGHFPMKRYKFKEVKKMTKSFKHKLGQGGYGDVFRGKLLDDGDGRLVAVKVLKASKGKGEEFINEVASISRTSHVNIVTLLGFCLEGKKRALVYEFMPNGSLEKFIYKDYTDASQANPRLDWDKLLQIASGIARGLEYLHRGCITKILHFDIKPHNILLDEEFCPKISDFGLAKLCSKKESVVTLMDARGTIGYIAPEVVSRNFGGVSSKSDVYSYGMMILEMVGGRKNMKIGVKNSSQVYFPDWIYKRLELGSELGLWGENMRGEENEIARKMILVGLWCIQAKPSDRPTMSKVIEMLEGNLQALQIPPRPSVFSSRSLAERSLPVELLTESLNSFGP